MSIRKTAGQRADKLDAVVERFVGEGYKVTDLKNTTATLYRKKRFNWGAFIIGSVLTIGLFAPLYLLYFLFLSRDEIMEIKVDAAGIAKATVRRG